MKANLEVTLYSIQLYLTLPPSLLLKRRGWEILSFSKFLHVGDEVLRDILGDGREGGPTICSSGCGEVAFSLLVAVVRGSGE